MSKSLTELWKKGKLEQWSYYFKLKNGFVIPAHPSELSKDDVKQVVKVVDYVPHYDEMNILRKENELYKKRCTFLEQAYKTLKEANELAECYIKQSKEII